ncbi:MAG: GGDEF domain-containing protein [Thermodesulfobacteriota bacterium]|nr:GGDEF domain-containing protein [Thermodesulfobacteriota bacterium]
MTDNDKTETEFQRYRITPRVLEDLEQRATPGMFFYIAVTLVVLGVNDFYLRHTVFSAIFFTAISVIAVFRIAQYYFIQRFYERHMQLKRRVLLASACATALTWGMGFAYFMVQPLATTSYVVVIASTVGLTAGGAIAFLPVWPLAVGYSVFTLLPGALTMGLLGIHLPIVVLLFVYMLYLAIITSRGNREYWGALENEHLLWLKNEEIRKLSRIDGLTGLYNRRYFEEIFNKSWKVAERNRTPIALMIGDIDHFKEINDTYGHPAGDLFLKEIARLLQDIVKRETDFIARYGGEEFVILMMNIGSEDTRQFAEKIHAEVSNMRVAYENQVMQVSLSLGVITGVPGREESTEGFLKKADDALYRAKKEGRNRVVFYGEA